MSVKDLLFVLLGEDRSASRVMSEAAANAEKSSARIGGAFSKVGGVLGGEFGSVLDRVGGGISQVGEKSGKLSSALIVGGGAVTGVGVALTMMGSGHKQAADQLQQAVINTGKFYGDYRDQFDKTIAKQENLGRSAIDTQDALRKLTTSTNDPKKALAEMGLVSDLAASKNISLSESADMVSRVLIGKGSRTLTSFGIILNTHTNTTKDLTTAQGGLTKAVSAHEAALLRLSQLQEIQHAKLTLSVSDHIALQNAQDNVANSRGRGSAAHEAALLRLSQLQEIQHQKQTLSASDQVALQNAQDNVTKSTDLLTKAQTNVTDAQDKASKATNNVQDSVDTLKKKLDGQAVKSVDNFGGQVNIAKTKLLDWGASVGEKFGPAFAAMGPILAIAGGVLEIYKAKQAIAAAATAASTAATVAGTGATDIATGSTWSLNAALAANPVGAIIIGVIALGTALLYFFTQTKLGKEVWSNMVAFFATTFFWLWNVVIKPVGDFIGGAFKAIGSTATTVFTTIGDIISGVFKTSVNIVRGAINIMIDLINGVIKNINGIGGAIKSATGGAIDIKLGTIPRLATGGVTNGPMLAVIGDNPGGREIVQPLSAYKADLAKERAAGTQSLGGKAAQGGFYIDKFITQAGQSPQEIASNLGWMTRWAT